MLYLFLNILFKQTTKNISKKYSHINITFFFSKSNYQQQSIVVDNKTAHM